MILIDRDATAEALRWIGDESAALLVLGRPVVAEKPEVRCRRCRNNSKGFCVYWQHEVKDPGGWCSGSARGDNGDII